MSKKKIELILEFIRSLYPNENPIPLHAPRFLGNEKKYLSECIDTTYVSYVGRFVSDFEEHIKHITGSRNAVALVNGTSAIQMMLIAAGVKHGEEVITQALTFAATAAGIKHVNAEPAFVDVDLDTLGMSPSSLREYLQANGERRTGGLYNKNNGRKIAAVVPMHTLGHPLRIDEISSICEDYGLLLLEDAAESIGSKYNGKHTGLFGKAAIISFNGNKPVTAGGGGVVITDDESIAERVRYISTTAKRKHRWEFYHDEVGYNLRLTNVNAAIGCAQMEYFDTIIDNKRETAKIYIDFFDTIDIPFVVEPEGTQSNYWLNSIILKDRDARDTFLQCTNDNGIQTRPIWTLMNKLPPYKNCYRTTLPNSEWLEDRVVSIPSSVRL